MVCRRHCVTASMLLALVGVASACPPPAGQCQTSNDCRSDEICLATQCRRVCNANNGCLGTESCVDGVCQPAGDSGGSAMDRPPSDGSTGDGLAPDHRQSDRMPADRSSDAHSPDVALPDAGVDAARPPLRAIHVAAGYSHSCAILAPGVIKCWGDNGSGQLGLGDLRSRGGQLNQMGNALPAVDFGARQPAAIAAGETHTCALTTGGEVFCWGDNSHGQLGVGDLDNRGDGPGEMGSALAAAILAQTEAVTEVAAGANHTCAIIGGRGVKCWGDNASGQLGLGDTVTRGDSIGNLDQNLPYVDLGAGSSGLQLLPSHVAAGPFHTCVVCQNGAVKCWGANGYGQLGLGDTLARGTLAGQMGIALPPVDLGSPALAIAVGSFHTCALLESGDIKCWGDNQAGQLGLGDNQRRGGLLNQMGSNLPAANVRADVARPVTALRAANLHSCALVEEGDLDCWGGNYSGQLGLGDTSNRGDDATELPPPLTSLGWPRAVLGIAIANDHGCALGPSGQVKCWGLASSGELGLGDVDNRGDAAGEMGDALPPVDLGS